MEIAPVDSTTNRPKTDIRIKDVTIFVDPFEEFMSQQKKKAGNKDAGAASEAHGKNDADEQHVDDDSVTWTGKRVRGWDGANASDSGAAGVGKYLKAALAEQHTRRAADEDEIVEFVDDEVEAPPLKKPKARGGFGNFEGW